MYQDKTMTKIKLSSCIMQMNQKLKNPIDKTLVNCRHSSVTRYWLLHQMVLGSIPVNNVTFTKHKIDQKLQQNESLSPSLRQLCGNFHELSDSLQSFETR